jgi:hypothetical protein
MSKRRIKEIVAAYVQKREYYCIETSNLIIKGETNNA